MNEGTEIRTGNALHSLGLGELDELVYAALLRRRGAEPGTAEDVMRELGLNRTELDGSLARLREHGFTFRYEEPCPGSLPCPAPPALAVRALIHRRQAELHSRAAELEWLRRDADGIAERLEPHSSGMDVPAVETVGGARDILRRVDQLLASAEREVLILDRPPYINPWAAEGADPGDALAALLERGVAVRVVIARDGLTLPGRVRLLTPLLRKGLRVRVAPDTPTKLVAVDGRTALLPPTSGSDPTRTAMVVRDGLLQNVLGPLFEGVWERALPLAGGGPRPAQEHHELLSLLAGGFKDEAMARRLGVHVHTVRRRITRLLDELDAQTRFQAGAQAALKGWLGPKPPGGAPPLAADVT